MDMHPPFDGSRGRFLVGHHGGPGALGWTIFALQLVLVVGVAWLAASTLVGALARRRRPAPARAGATPDPLEVLRMRYARGEIGRDEYLQARADLGAARDDETAN